MKRFLLSLIVIAAFSINTAQAQCPLTDAVDFTATTVEGETVHLFDILDNEGKYVVIDFFFCTCVPCQQASPLINEAYIYFGCNEGDVIFLAIDTGDTDEECIEFDETYGVEYPTISGVEGGGTQICNDYMIPAYPTVILIAPDHSIVEQDIWPIPDAQAVIDALEPHGLEETECEGEVSFAAGFYAEPTDACETPAVIDFYSDCIGDPTSWSWSFDGGIPETSLDENPTITYLEEGSYDVTLIVSDGIEWDTLAIEKYIGVHGLPEVYWNDVEDLCNEDWDPYELTQGQPEGGVYSGDFVSDGMYFHPTEAGAGEHEVTYTYTDEFGCENSENYMLNVVNCVGIEEKEAFTLELFPNPTSGIFTINLSAKEFSNADLKVMDAMGKEVFNQTVNVNGTYSTRVDLSSQPQGVYFVVVSGEKQNLSRKIFVRH